MFDKRGRERPLGVGRFIAALFAALSMISAAADDLETRIEQARALSITDPTGEGLELLLDLQARGEDATPSEQAEIELMLIRAIALKGRNREAMERALALTDSAPEVVQQVSAMRLAANLAINTGNYELAFTQLQRAMGALEGIDSSKDEVTVFGMVSTFHSRAGDTLLAMDYAEKALASARRSGSVRLECIASNWLGLAHAAAGEIATAVALGEHSLELCAQIGDHVTMTWIRNMLANLALDEGRIDEAERLLDASLQETPDIYHDLRIESDLIRARIELLRGNYASALDRYQSLGRELGSSQRRGQLAAALDGAAQAAHRMGDLETAVVFYKAQLAARREHMEQVNSLQLAQLALGFDQALRNQEINLLREQERYRELIDQSQAKRRQLVTLATIGGAILALILLVGLLHTLRERRHFRRLSDRDGLTQLFNHTRFFKQLDRELAEQTRRSVVLIMADIDHFKQVNDRFGHQIGDEVLRQTARVLREVFGPEQLIGRIGGEEFAIRLLDHRPDHAVERIEALRARLAGAARRPTDPPITLSFGLGVHRPGESLEQLRQRTDEALYQAKAQGRNCLVLADPIRAEN
jgi:diguanylate cyclase (GGDEF)-like protein